MSLKQAIRRVNESRFDSDFEAQVNRGLVRVGMLVSGVGSVSGCICLMLALVNVAQVKLGTLSCGKGTGHTFAAVVPLVILVPLGLLIYVCVVLYAFLAA